jgi:hypothetical protein
MASIEDALASLVKNAGKNSAVIKDLTKSMKQLTAARKAFQASGDPKAMLAVKNMTKAMESLISTTEEYIGAQKALKQIKSSGSKADEETIKRLDEIAIAYDKTRKTVTQAGKSLDYLKERQKQAADQWEADALKYFRNHTLVGKGFGLLSGVAGSFAAKLTFTGLAWKAATRHMQAAEIQQNILIQNYRGLSKETTTWGDKFKSATSGIPVVGGAIGDYGKKTMEAHSNIVGFTEATYNMSDALRETEATAQRMGVSTEYVSEAFTKFSRIAGTQSPRVLKTLSEGAITVSRSLGITVPEAIDFVNTRMDKFGGSAAGAIASLNNMRVEAERINVSFGRTVIRGDDVARTLQEISKQTTVYSIDQRYVGNILRENIARLQSTGKSYEQASKQAQVFSEAVTGKAPEWMKVFAAQDLNKQLMSSFEAGDFVEKFGSELEAAKPGLTKEVQSIMADMKSGKVAQYSGMMAIQEMVGGTTVGIGAMNTQILKLAKHPQGLVLIAKQFGISLAEARGMVTQAESMQERTGVLNTLTAKGVDLKKQEFTLSGKTFKLNQDQISDLEKIDKSGETALEKEKQKKEYLNAIIDTKNEEITLEQDMARLKTEDVMNQKQMAVLDRKVQTILAKKVELQQKLVAAKAKGNPEEIKEIEKTIAFNEKLLQQAELDKTRFESKVAEGTGATEGLKTVEEINKELLKQFEGYSLNSGNSAKAILTELSSTKLLLIGAGVMGFAKFFLNWTGAFSRIEKAVARWAIGAKDDKAGDAVAETIKDNIDPKTGGAKGGDYGPKPQKEQGKLGKLASKLKRPTGGYGASFGKDIDFAKVAGVAGAAAGLKTSMEMLTAEYDKDGKLIDKSTKLMGLNLDKSASNIAAFGTGLSAMPGKMGKLGGQVAMLGAAYEAGAAIGSVLNMGLDKLGLTSDVVGQKMADMAAKGDGFWGKTLKAIGPEMVDTKKMEKDNNKTMMASIMRKGLSEKEAKGVMEKSEKDKVSVTKILTDMGKIPANAGQLKKGTALSGATMPSAVGAELSKAAATTATKVATEAAAATATTAADTGGTGGGMSGSFQGGPSADGSIMLKVENFMTAFSKAGAMSKQKTQRQSG